MRQYAIYVLGGAAAVMGVAGFLVGFIYSPALFTHGLFLTVLGLCYAAAFIREVGTDKDIGYYAGLGTAGLGLLAFLCALAWSMRSLLAKWHWINSTPEFWLMPNGPDPDGTGSGLFIFRRIDGLLSAQVLVLLRRELGLFLFTPIVYVIYFGFAFIAAILFYPFVQFLWNSAAPIMPGESPARVVQEPMAQHYVLSVLPIICNLFVVPILTMHLLSEEKRTGTLEMALTAPAEREVPVVIAASSSPHLPSFTSRGLDALGVFIWWNAARRGDRASRSTTLH